MNDTELVYRLSEDYRIMADRAEAAEAERDKLREAAKAYRYLCTCYRLGNRLSEALFARPEKANAALEETK